MVGAPTRCACVIGSVWWPLLAAEILSLAVVAPRLWRASRGGRRLSSVVTDRNDAADISVVIPARNEAGRITDCIIPLRNAPGVREVIVVDDQSSDDTASIARALGAVVVAGEPLTDGWVGKIWALHQGIQAATGEIVVTLDADARPDASLPRAATNALRDSGAKLATVAPRFRLASSTGRWLHASMLTSLVYRHGAGGGTASRDAIANGQCMVFRREDAVRGAWCESVKQHIVEDVALVRHLVQTGENVEMFDGSSVLAVQMFDGFSDTWRGWGRSLALTGVDRVNRQLADLFVTAVTLVLPLWLVMLDGASPISFVLLFCRVGTLIGTRRAYERRGIGYWLSPLADLLAWIVVAKGVVSPPREWRGRKY